MARKIPTEIEKLREKNVRREHAFAERRALYVELGERYADSYASRDFPGLYGRLEEIISRAQKCNARLSYGTCQNQFGIRVAFAEFPDLEKAARTEILEVRPRVQLGPAEQIGKVVIRYIKLSPGKFLVPGKPLGKKIVVDFDKLSEKYLLTVLCPLFMAQTGRGFKANSNWLRKLEAEFDANRKSRIHQNKIQNFFYSRRRRNYTNHDFKEVYRRIFEFVDWKNDACNEFLCGTRVLKNHVKILYIIPKRLAARFAVDPIKVRPQIRFFPSCSTGIDLCRLDVTAKDVTGEELPVIRSKSLPLERINNQLLETHLDWLIKSFNFYYG